MSLKVYTYAGCSSCKQAVKFLKASGRDFTEIPIREQPPSKGELRSMLKAYEGKLRRLFNVAGQDYRALGLGSKLDSMTEDEALNLLSQNGNLVKRPFAIGKGVHLVGFDEQTWQAISGA